MKGLAWKPLEAGDVVLAKGLASGGDVIFLLLGESQADFVEVGLRPAWRCLVLHSRCAGLEPGQIYTPDQDFLGKGERL